ncbi:MAG: hypothetical protein CK425_06120 [Parachlamydia sp.]|nr:MAG: hypothetical protein CK425_06120 [Parachlamydia sp.]
MVQEAASKNTSIIAKRIINILESDHFGDFKHVSDYDKGITKDCAFELRWKDEKRIYYGEIVLSLFTAPLWR